MNPEPHAANPNPSGARTERGFDKVILRLVTRGPERRALEAGQVDAIIDPASGKLILLPEAQQALIERQAGFRSLAGLAADWHWVQDGQHRFVSHSGMGAENSRAGELGGESVIGKTLWELSIDNLSESDWHTHRRQLEWRSTFRDLEVRHVDRTGTARYFSVSGEPVFDDQHQFQGYRGITRNISERKHLEELAQNRIRYGRPALDALAEPAGVLDAAGMVLVANRAWRASAETLSGIGAGVAEGANYLEACDDAAGNERVDAIAIAAGIRQVLAGERALFRYEYGGDVAAGRCWFTLSISQVSGDSEARALVLREDITERKRAELLLGLECTVARCLADADSASAALKAVIRAVCETQGWDCGRYFRLEPATGVLCFDESWGVPTADVQKFLEKSRAIVFRPGAGLKGRVFQSGQPLWVLDGASDGSVSPMALAPETGRHGSFVFPVMTEESTIGVLAFTSPAVRAPDDRLLWTVQSIGSLLGRFLQRQQARDALRRSEERFRKLTELSCDWYWEQDRDYRFTQMIGCGVLGTGDVIGKTRWELPNILLSDAEWARHKSQLAERWSFCDFEFAAVQPDGQLGYYCISGEPVYDQAGAFAGYCGTGMDITKRKLAEIALRESEARLRAVVELSSN